MRTKIWSYIPYMPPLEFNNGNTNKLPEGYMWAMAIPRQAQSVTGRIFNPIENHRKKPTSFPTHIIKKETKKNDYVFCRKCLVKEVTEHTGRQYYERIPATKNPQWRDQTGAIALFFQLQ